MKFKLLGVTQGSSLRVFWHISQHLGIEHECALYVSNSATYTRLVAKLPAIAAVPTLKEWKITAEARTAKPDIARLKTLQTETPSSLWHSLLADRRVFFGSLCKARQDYRSRYSEEEMLALLDVASRRIDAFLEAERPDMVLGFGCATFGDYLFELLARRRCILVGQLKATKIDNHVALMDTGIGPSQALNKAHRAMNPIPETLQSQVACYLKNVRRQGVKYEGAILFGRDRMLAKLRSAPRQLVAAYLTDRARRRIPEQFDDPHIPKSLPTAWYTHVVHPLRTFRLGRRLPLLGPEAVADLSHFVFYPMHFEPEVSLQVFGRPFQNQIEVIRTLALNLPVGTQLLVKEHPRSLGFRKESYYRKLLEIPNVRLADPFIPTIGIVRRAKLICVISGSVGLEAAIVGKPVLVLGCTPYTLLPKSMVQQAGDLNLIDTQIKELIDGYKLDDASLERYLAALLSISVPVNLYTKMLGKSDRYADPADQRSVDEEYRRLGDLIRTRLVGSTHDTLATA
jgi:hypothetical protein